MSEMVSQHPAVGGAGISLVLVEEEGDGIGKVVGYWMLGWGVRWFYYGGEKQVVWIGGVRVDQARGTGQRSEDSVKDDFFW
jgi:hypothetical protein